MFMPKRVKRRKQFRGSMKGKALRGNKITNGEYGLSLIHIQMCIRDSPDIEYTLLKICLYLLVIVTSLIGKVNGFKGEIQFSKASLYFVIEEKLNSVDLTDKGVDLITGNSEDPTHCLLYTSRCV